MLVLLAKFLEHVIMKLELNVIFSKTHVSDCIMTNKPLFQFLKHDYGYLDMGIAFLKFLEYCNFFDFHNGLSMIYILTFKY